MHDPKRRTANFALLPVALSAFALSFLHTLESQSGEQSKKASSGNKRVSPSVDKETRRRAMRLIRMLELPDKRAAAAEELTGLGADAVPGLILALDDPRPDVVARLALVLRMLGEDARPAIPTLRRIAQQGKRSANTKRASSDKSDASSGKSRTQRSDASTDAARVAFAARWALAPFEPSGTILISQGNGAVVVELDGDRKETFRLENSRNAFRAERLPTGNYLLAAVQASGVRELDPSGKVVWKDETVKMPTMATRLPSGNTLICSSASQGVVEITASGKRVWHHPCKAAYSASRLRNGNTLIADYTKSEVIEVTKEGETVWKYTTLKGPLHALRRANGNTLITSQRQYKVHEVSPDEDLVRRYKLPASGWSACELADGGILVAGNKYLVCFDSKGKRRWKKDMARVVTSVYQY